MYHVASSENKDNAFSGPDTLTLRQKDKTIVMVNDRESESRKMARRQQTFAELVPWMRLKEVLSFKNQGISESNCDRHRTESETAYVVQRAEQGPKRNFREAEMRQ